MLAGVSLRISSTLIVSSARDLRTLHPESLVKNLRKDQKKAMISRKGRKKKMMKSKLLMKKLLILPPIYQTMMTMILKRFARSTAPKRKRVSHQMMRRRKQPRSSQMEMPRPPTKSLLPRIA